MACGMPMQTSNVKGNHPCGLVFSCSNKSCNLYDHLYMMLVIIKVIAFAESLSLVFMACPFSFYIKIKYIYKQFALV